MKQLLYRVLLGCRVPDLLLRLRRRKAMVLMYHGFTDRPSHDGIENFEGLHLDVAMFRRHLQYLREHCNVVSLRALVDHCLNGAALPPNPVVLTMDDGYRSNYAFAYPLLREYDVPATVFLTTGFVDRREFQWTDRLEYAVGHAPEAKLDRADGDEAGGHNFRGGRLIEEKSRLKQVPQESRAAAVDDIERTLGCSLVSAAHVPDIYEPLEWSEIQEMHESGLVEFGSHTVSHFILSRCEGDAIRQEIREAKATIEERLEIPCPLFCYPNGRRQDFDRRTRAGVQEAGHTCALTTIAGSVERGSDVYEIRRVGVMNDQSFADFVMAVAGISRGVTLFGDLVRRLRIRR